MRNFLFAMLALGLTAVSLSACSGSKVRITEKDNAQTFTLQPGDTLSLSIEGNPTTGYNWEIEEVDTSILAPIGDPQYKSSSSLIGTGGTYTFTFEAKAIGTTNLKLKYYRSFEKDTPPIQTFAVTVNVQ